MSKLRRSVTKRMNIYLTNRKFKLLLRSLIGLTLIAIPYFLLCHRPSKSQAADVLYERVLPQPLIHHASGNIEQGCVMPKLNMHSSIEENIASTNSKPQIVCSDEEDWVKARNGKLYFTKSALEKYSNRIKCIVTYMLRVNDFEQIRGSSVEFNSDNNITEMPMSDDFAWIDCKVPTTKWFKFSPVWNSIVATVVPKHPLVRNLITHEENTMNVDSRKLNVLFFGFDSVSRINFMSRLPRMYKYLTEDLDAVVLQNYNIVGDGTTAAMLAMLVGEYEEDLPETRRGKSDTFVDVYPFAFYNYSAAGYATVYGEDQSSIATFHYRLNGFNKKPSDHYMRTFQTEAESRKRPQFCLGSTPKLDVLMQYLEDTFKVYPDSIPKFVFGFHNEYSHDLFEMLPVADEPATAWLEKLHTSGVLDNTILVILSDHGHRFSKTRETLQGKYEERLPFFAIRTPTWFTEKFPNAAHALRINAADRLTSPFDVHATLMSILDTLNKGQDTQPKHKDIVRGMSLFSEIPARRTCANAKISPHWCACNSWVEIRSNDTLVRRATQSIVTFMNELIAESNQQSKCAHLKFSEIRRARMQLPQKNMIKFKSSSDFDGRVPDLSSQTMIDKVLFEVQLLTNLAMVFSRQPQNISLQVISLKSQ